MKALIIVDIQNDFLPGGSLAVNQGEEIIDYVNQLQHKYDIVVATQDWHPSKHKSFVSQHPGKAVFDTITLNGLQQTLWPDHCIQSSEGARFSDKLNQEKIEAIFRKGTDTSIDSYSGFFDNGRKKSTGLHGFLQNKNINEVHICGLAADYCVYFTAMDAIHLGYKTAIISKGTKAIDKSSYMDKKELFIQNGGFFI